jgi:hypothetical protein
VPIAVRATMYDDDAHPIAASVLSSTRTYPGDSSVAYIECHRRNLRASEAQEDKAATRCSTIRGKRIIVQERGRCRVRQKGDKRRAPGDAWLCCPRYPLRPLQVLRLGIRRRGCGGVVAGKRRHQRAEKLTRAAGYRQLHFNGSFAGSPPSPPLVSRRQREKRSNVQQDSSSAVDQQHYSKPASPRPAATGFGYSRFLASFYALSLPPSSLEHCPPNSYRAGSLSIRRRSLCFFRSKKKWPPRHWKPGICTALAPS